MAEKAIYTKETTSSESPFDGDGLIDLFESLVQLFEDVEPLASNNDNLLERLEEHKHQFKAMIDVRLRLLTAWKLEALMKEECEKRILPTLPKGVKWHPPSTEQMNEFMKGLEETIKEEGTIKMKVNKDGIVLACQKKKE